VDYETFDDLVVTWRNDEDRRPSAAVLACLKMIESYRNEEGCEWEDVDDAWETAREAVRRAA
jgi:hypothetical protein